MLPSIQKDLKHCVFFSVQCIFSVCVRSGTVRPFCINEKWKVRHNRMRLRDDVAGESPVLFAQCYLHNGTFIVTQRQLVCASLNVCRCVFHCVYMSVCKVEGDQG